MVDPRSYTKSTLWALVALGRSSCYWPDPPCSQRAIVMVKGQPVTNLEIAHIYAAHPDGPRYRADMTDAERRHASSYPFSALSTTCSLTRFGRASTPLRS